MIRLLFAILAWLAATLPAASFETQATAAYVIDQGTGTVLLSQNADTPLPPASMSKLMTLYMAFEALERGKNNGGLSMDEELRVSEHAMSYGGSTLFLRAGERVKVEDLIRGIIVLSGNDACVVIAETLSPDGTEAGFAKLMTQRAAQLGMTHSTFTNSNGWPSEGHRMSMRDLGLISHRLISDFPQYYPMFAETEFLFDPQESQNRFNRNPLLGLGIGADGLKTGRTREAGFGLAGSAKQGDRRVIFVISGLQSAAARAREAEAIVNWAFRQFSETTVGTAGTQLASAPVALGAQDSVGLALAEDLTVLTPSIGEARLQAEIVYRGPITAPLAKGAHIADLHIARDSLPDVTVPLIAASTVEKGGFFVRVSAAAHHLMARLGVRTSDAS
ncbi:MAG: D-alanyl-D-alanine carboxypeptidase family protein [Pseudomonadota bacterium]